MKFWVEGLLFLTISEFVVDEDQEV